MESLLFDEEIDQYEKYRGRIDERKVDQAIHLNQKGEIVDYIEKYHSIIRDVKETLFELNKKNESSQFHFNNFMKDRELLMDQLEKDLKAKTEEYERQSKSLAEIMQAEEYKSRTSLANLKRDLTQNEVMPAQQLRDKYEVRLKAGVHIKAEEVETKKNIASTQAELDKVRERNRTELPKLTLEREGEEKKEKDELETKARDVDQEKLRRDDERGKYEEFVQKAQEYKDQIKLQGEQMSQYRLDNKRELTDFMKNEDALIEYQTLTFKQSKKIKELKDEIEQLSKKFPEEVAKYTKEIEFLKFDNENKKNELEYKYQSITDSLRVKHKESKALRRLLQLILDQRSELEHFFIEEIMNAIQLKEKVAKAKSNKPGSTKSTLSQSMKAGGGFSWEERQAIIEKVLHRVRDGPLPVYWREINIDDLKRAIIREEEKKQMRRGGEDAEENARDEEEMRKVTDVGLHED